MEVEFYSKELKQYVKVVFKEEANKLVSNASHLCTVRAEALVNIIGPCAYSGRCAELKNERREFVHLWDPINEASCGDVDSLIYGFITIKPRSLYSNILHRYDLEI